ncbi:MAG: hypothetical protein NT062_15730 [Proteobacteria bacterium]|nr:hypothetical protein [Pseudomonadota bacterium]
MRAARDRGGRAAHAQDLRAGRARERSRHVRCPARWAHRGRARGARPARQGRRARQGAVAPRAAPGSDRDAARQRRGGHPRALPARDARRHPRLPPARADHRHRGRAALRAPRADRPDGDRHQPHRDRGVRRGQPAVRVPQRTAQRSRSRGRPAAEGDRQDQQDLAQAVQGHVHRHQRDLQGSVPAAVPRRPGRAVAVRQPPGKKNTTVDQLSGGEKALTAVALVFSIFLIKPSPFCILDEVDAPLDEANVDRYNEIVREMTDRSQFIVITHNKRTMESADALYGVTMQEPGVSKLVSVNLQRVGHKAGSAGHPASASA